MHPLRLEELHALLPPGDVAGYGQIREVLTRRELARALRSGLLVRLGRGKYRIGPPTDSRTGARPWPEWDNPPTIAERHAIAADIALAKAHGGVLAGLSAARAHDWMLPVTPGRTQIIVPAGRTPPTTPRGKVRLQWRTLAPHEHLDSVTTPLTTAVHCASSLPFPAALALLDSALRSGLVTREELVEAAHTYRGRGARVLRRAALAADPRAANPFESLARGASATVPGLRLEPQVTIDAMDRRYRVDLCDRRARVVVECDSYRFHVDRRDRWLADVERYNALTATGWRVIRVTWPHVTSRIEDLHDALARLLARRLASPPSRQPGPPVRASADHRRR